jgi:CheY-like chemotaxis protein/putative methionine-R-sulfoxide reductase with GAF domain
MVRFTRQPTPTADLAIVFSLAGVFAADLFTPFGVAVWVFYLIPVILGLYVCRPLTPLFTAFVSTLLTGAGLFISLPPSDTAVAFIPWLNRVLGAMALWIVAIFTQQAIITKLKLREQDWVRSGQRDLAARMQGEQSPRSLGEQVLRFLCEYLEVPVGVLYVAEQDDGLSRLASYAAGQDPLGPARVAPGDGIVGQAFKDRRVLRLDDLPDGYLRVSSALGQASPRHLVVVPAIVDDRVQAVIELGFLHPVGFSDMDLLGAVAELVASGIRSSRYRARLEDFLAETQRQSEALRRQQEKLRITNEELESQSRALSESQTRLESQNAELEETNARLEQQRDELARARVDLLERSEELARVNRYKSEFLANMSHELRTPLNSTLILSRLLADNKDGNLTPDQVKYATIIHSSGNDLLDLINDILDLSRIEAGRLEIRPEPVRLESLVEALQRTFQPMAAQKNLVFEAVVEPHTVPAIGTDPLRLQQILRNLLSNAIKFTEAGKVSLRVFQAGPGRVGFAVSDTGVGIPAGRQEVIFEAFRQADGSTQRKYGGTGLGLTISRELAHRLGGDISVESEPDRGSTFTLVLPVEPPPRSDPAPPPEPAAVPARLEPAAGRSAASPKTPRQPPPDDRASLRPGDRSILIIEDDEAFAAILCDLAREMHFRCLIATNAGEGLEFAAHYGPSAIVLDIHLPDGSGLTVLERLKGQAATRHIPVHVISIADYAQQALEMGAIGYVLKPVMREQIVGAFRKLEEKLEQNIRRVLVVEDVAAQRESIEHLLRTVGVEVVAVETGGEALAQLKEATFDCMVLDLSLPDMSGYDLLDKMATGEAFSFPPVIVYTGRTLTRDEEERLRRYAGSIIIKGARSPERLLDEVTLFLHQIEAHLPKAQQSILRELRSREKALEGRTILVVEDDVRNVFALSSVLEPKGAKLRIARNGREALQALERTAREPVPVDLVLMDIMMPEMDGLTATREIRKRPEWKKLPIIALTAKAMPDDRALCLEAGANDYIAKPLDVEKLVSLIKVWMPK